MFINIQKYDLDNQEILLNHQSSTIIYTLFLKTSLTLEIK